MVDFPAMDDGSLWLCHMAARNPVLPWMPVASHGEMGGIRPEILVKYEGNGWKLNSGLTLALW